MQRKFLINFPMAVPGREAPGRSGTARAPCSGPPSAWAPRWPRPRPWTWSWRRWKCWQSCAGWLPCAGCWAPRCLPSCRLYLPLNKNSTFILSPERTPPHPRNSNHPLTTKIHPVMQHKSQNKLTSSFLRKILLCKQKNWTAVWIIQETRTFSRLQSHD